MEQVFALVPFVSAIAVTILFVASIFTPWAVVWGSIPVVIALILWFWPSKIEPTPEPVAAPPAVADVTGAGDAMAGTMTVALLCGMDLGAALREGVAAALLAIASPIAAPAFSRQEFAKTLALVPHAVEMR